jgi:hypothetical protein
VTIRCPVMVLSFQQAAKVGAGESSRRILHELQWAPNARAGFSRKMV